MLRYSVYYKAFNDLYINPDNETNYITTLKDIDYELTDTFLKKIDPIFTPIDLLNEKDIDKIVDKLYPAQCNPYDMSYNIEGIPSQRENLDIIKGVIGLFEQLQLRFNYESMNKCGAPIKLSNYMTSLKDDKYPIKYTNNYCDKTGDNYLSSKMAHDLYVYLHCGIKKGTEDLYIIRLLKIVGKIQRYIYNNYKFRRCF